MLAQRVLVIIYNCFTNNICIITITLAVGVLTDSSCSYDFSVSICFRDASSLSLDIDQFIVQSFDVVTLFRQIYY